MQASGQGATPLWVECSVRVDCVPAAFFSFIGQEITAAASAPTDTAAGKKGLFFTVFLASVDFWQHDTD
jgi:hypothetical protein